MTHSVPPSAPSQEPQLELHAERPEPHCPRCRSRDIRRSQSRHLFDAIARTLGYEPQRCRACRQRFFMHEDVA